MAADASGKVILATFAGRKDRMELLCWYAQAAMRAGLVDEWHVWDFSRNEDDAAWLRQRFPLVRMTPSSGTGYYPAHLSVPVGHVPGRIDVAVSATNDVHLGLRRVDGTGPSYEIVVGGWGNRRSILRAFADPERLLQTTERGGAETLLQERSSPGVLPRYGYAQISAELGLHGIKVTVGGTVVLEVPDPVPPGTFRVLHRSGFGCNAEWRFAGHAGAQAYLFLSGPRPPTTAPSSGPRYLAFYQHYARHVPTYRNDIFLKCDDDIVFIDLPRLRDFIAFRRANPQFFLVSANVVNNGVCAHFQQRRGIIPPAVTSLELPKKGLGGSLWSSAVKATAVHREFLRAPQRFMQPEPERIIWNERLSINFVGLLGEDFVHIDDAMVDDEDFLCYGARERAWKDNAIHWPFVVAHLSFYPQDARMDLGALLALYRDLARRTGVAPDSPPREDAEPADAGTVAP